MGLPTLEVPFHWRKDWSSDWMGLGGGCEGKQAGIYSMVDWFGSQITTSFVTFLWELSIHFHMNMSIYIRIYVSGPGPGCCEMTEGGQPTPDWEARMSFLGVDILRKDASQATASGSLSSSGQHSWEGPPRSFALRRLSPPEFQASTHTTPCVYTLVHVFTHTHSCSFH